MRELANISFIRLEPVSNEDISYEADLAPRPETKNMAVIWCAGALTGHTGGHYMYHPTDSQWFVNDFEGYRNSDFGIFCVEAMRRKNFCLFKTCHGDTGNWDRSWGPDWVDPLEEFTREAVFRGGGSFVIMPASVRIDERRILVAVRCREHRSDNDTTAPCWIDLYLSEDNAASWRRPLPAGSEYGKRRQPTDPDEAVGRADLPDLRLSQSALRDARQAE